MTTDEWKDVAKILNALYDDGTRYMFEPQDTDKMQAWYSCLSDLEYEGVCKAVRNISMKSPYKPKISDIRKEYANITTPQRMTEQEAWEIVAEGIRNGTYGATEEFAKFPADIQRAVVSPSALTEWAALPSEKVHSVIQPLFKKSYAAVLERKNEEAILGAIGTKSGELAALTENLEKQLTAK